MIIILNRTILPQASLPVGTVSLPGRAAICRRDWLGKIESAALDEFKWLPGPNWPCPTRRPLAIDGARRLAYIGTRSRGPASSSFAHQFAQSNEKLEVDGAEAMIIIIAAAAKEPRRTNDD